MKLFISIVATLLITTTFHVIIVNAQQYDILLKGGHVIDPKNDVDGPLDIAIRDGLISQVASNIPSSSAESVVDVRGMYVTPGFIDIHSHHFHGTNPHTGIMDGFSSLPVDGFTLRAGVTTVVDPGSPGWRNFREYKERVIDRSRTRVLAMLNIVGHGMRPAIPYQQNYNDMNPKMTAMVANQYPEIVGVKIGHYRSGNWEPYRWAVEAGNLADIPVMVDFGGAEVALSLDTLFFEVLRPGDIYTHAFGGGMTSHGDRQAIVHLEDGTLRSRMFEAQERGIIFDIGFGGGSFFYEVAVPATEQNFWPNTISTDLHTGSMNGGMKNMANAVSTVMNLGMPLQEAIKASTWKPAQVIQREDLGHLSVGAEADIAVFRLLEGDFGFQDSRRNVIPGNEKLEVELTLRAGRVVWDLNGITSSRWSE